MTLSNRTETLAFALITKLKKQLEWVLAAAGGKPVYRVKCSGVGKIAQLIRFTLWRSNMMKRKLKL